MSSITSPASTSSDHASDTASSRRKSRVSAEHTLNRVRENQRRHRARQRDRVACLEEKLAETEQELADARAEIALLKAQQDVTNSLCRSAEMNVLSGDAVSIDAHDDNRRADTDATPFSYLTNTPDLSFLPEDMSSAFLIDINTFSLPLPPPSLDSAGPPPCCSDTPAPSLPSDSNLPEDPECSTCKTKPLPDPSESTTLCAQAFVLISQQNFRNLDPGTIRMWLAQGLRRARREGEGCRVENGALWRLLDYISGM
jgi:hypothetical protein